MRIQGLARGAIAAAFVLGALSTACGAATNDKVLYSFCAQASCADGAVPLGSLIEDSAGDFFGTTFQGGDNLVGVAYELVPKDRGYHYKILHQFCSRTNCADGASPITILIMDTSGNLYGTTHNGGVGDNGTVFELVANATHTKFRLVTLYDFCSLPSCTDGINPSGGLTYAGKETGALYDGTSPLFVTDVGAPAMGGVALELKSVAGKVKRKPKIVYAFCQQPNCADGSTPQELTIDAGGNLFGTAFHGGLNNEGLVFELSPVGGGFSETVLYTFCPSEPCIDGRSPLGGVAQDSNGTLFGTTEFGGANDQGTVFKVVPNGTSSKEAVLYSFCATSGCLDGAEPQSGPIIDPNGNLIGTTPLGGANDFSGGTIYRLHGKSHTVLYSFCKKTNCADGRQPTSGILRDSTGTLFGATSIGGVNGEGSVFQFKP